MPKATIYENPLTDDQLRWLWARYRRCGFPIASFPKRFARNSFESLTDRKGKNMAVSLAFQYRRQIIHARKTVTAALTFDRFIAVVRRLHAKETQNAKLHDVVRAQLWEPETPLKAILRSMIDTALPDPPQPAPSPPWMPDTTQAAPDGQLSLAFA